VDQAHLAAIYAALGDKDKAFAALDQACDGREVSIERIYNRVIFDELLRRSDLTPGFTSRTLRMIFA